MRGSSGLNSPREHVCSVGMRACEAPLNLPPYLFIYSGLSGSFDEVVVIRVTERAVAGGQEAGLVAAAFAVA